MRELSVLDKNKKNTYIVSHYYTRVTNNQFTAKRITLRTQTYGKLFIKKYKISNICRVLYETSLSMKGRQCRNLYCVYIQCIQVTQ